MKRAPAPTAPAAGSGPGQPPSTFQHIERHARTHPERTALICGDMSITFARFRSDVLRFSAAVGEQGVSRGELVLVSHPHPYVHWLVLLACENAGAVSASYGSSAEIKSSPAVARADHVFANAAPPEGAGHSRFLALDDAWLARVFRRPLREVRRHPRERLGPHDPQRLTHSSGTTGTQKAMLLTRGAQDRKLTMLQESSGISRESRVWLTMPFAVNSVYLLASLGARLGALVIVAPALEALTRHKATYFEALPLMLDKMLQELPPELGGPLPIRARVIGAPLTRGLRAAALASLCTEISGRYATNEAWPIATDVDVDQEGLLFPGVEIRILDGDGRDVAEGQAGQVAVKSPTLVDGFLDDPAATRDHFHEGWFLTGDLGQLVAPGRLRLLGRCDDVINRGGLKLQPASMEAALRKVPGVRDAAVASLSAGGSMDALGVGVVLEDGADEAKAVAAVRSAMSGWSDVRVKVLPELPRTTNGKLSRNALRGMFKASQQ